MKYRVESAFDLTEAQRESLGFYDSSDYCWVLLDDADNIIGCDGGEPEDQVLVRDWSWVVDAMNKAHADGVNEERERCLRLIRTEADTHHRRGEDETGIPKLVAEEIALTLWRVADAIREGN